MGMHLRYGMTAADTGLGIPFNFGSPSFGFLAWDVPVFIDVGPEGANDAASETYAFCTNASALPVLGGAPYDWRCAITAQKMGSHNCAPLLTGRVPHSTLTIATLVWSGPQPGAALLDLRMRGATAPGVNNIYEVRNAPGRRRLRSVRLKLCT